MKSLVVWRSVTLQENFQTVHFEELRELYISPDIILVLKLRRMAWFGHRYVRGLVGKREDETPLGSP